MSEQTIWQVFDPRQGLHVLDLDEPTARDDGSWLVPSAALRDEVQNSTADFLAAIHPGWPGDWLEVRAFSKDPALSFPKTEFIPLPLNRARIEDVQQFAQRHGDRYDVYHAVADRHSNQGGKLEQCSNLWALFTEIDFKHGVPLLTIWNALQDFPLSPSAIVHSGGGLHVYWLLDEPLDLQTELGRVRGGQWLGDLAYRLGGDLVAAEPARVLRVPDTFNRKPEYGPTARRVTLLDFDWSRRYTLAEVVAVLGDADPTAETTPIVPAASAVPEHGLTVEERIDMARAWLTTQAPAVNGQGGNDHTYQVCCGVAIGHDLTEAQTFASLSEWNARCQPPWSERELRVIIRNAIRYGQGQRGEKLLTFPDTEAGDAEFFAQRYGDRLRFDHRRGQWLVFKKSGHWLPDPAEYLHQLGIKAMRGRQARANMIADKGRRAQAWAWAIRGESRSRIINMLVLARSIAAIAIAKDDDTWDADPWLLGVENGVVDLRTGQVRPGRAGDHVTKTARARFDPAATCPLWQQTIGEIFSDDAEVITFVQRALGYSLTGDCREECFFLCWGGGANGKGTLMNTVSWLLGEYADDLPFSALELRERSGIPNDIAKLVGRRFVTASESSEVRLNEARVKALTGRDPITARFLHREFFTFQPVAKFWLATNTKPIVHDDSAGFWRRIHTIPFTQTFAGREDKTLKDKLRAEAAGILGWLVRGCLDWQRDGLNPPEAVTIATRQYRDESGVLAPFFEARCEIDPAFSVQAGPLFQTYEYWCEKQHIPARERLSSRRFGEEIKKRFAVDEMKKRHVWYLGIGLRDSQRGNHDGQGELPV